MAEYIIGIIIYSIWEYALGKIKKPKANSTLELIENGVKFIAKRNDKKWE